ncbi:sensor histidine kinase [Halobaculum limi]|uniref:sensor histidine kinase n=1 Tax=Halobaculum limi TaxID=3031916 RepID=UPI00240721A9|nr:GAF domain-containing sensor histidine kinase [Halobaculum sp. YSMS11]
MTGDRADDTPADDRLQSLYAATQDLLTASTRSALCEVVVDVSRRVLGYTQPRVHLRPAVGRDRLEPTAYPDAVADRFDGEPPTYTPGDRAYEAFDRGESRRLRTPSTQSGDAAQRVVVPIADHGVLVAGAAANAPSTGAPVGLVESLAETAALALERLDREARLNGLHETTQELMDARDTAAVAATATNIAHEVLDLRLNAVCLRSSDGTRLVPVSVTSEARALFGTVPELDAGTVAWEAYESGELVCHDDVRQSPAVTDQSTPIRSELVVPLGDHGIFLAGSERVGRFDDTDETLARLFADTVEAALDRAQRETLARHREHELERQNERLDEFASVVSHDLRNPLNVAQGRTELLGDDCDSPHLSHIETAHDRMEVLIEDLLALARSGRSVGETEPIRLAPTVRAVWQTIDGGGSLAVGDDVGTVVADDSRLRQLFENLFRNAVDHAGDGVIVTVGRIKAPNREGFYVADDGPGIPPADRGQVFERGHTTADDGTGFGLAIVAEVASVHGWSVSVTDSVDGGARFEVVVAER